jgi:hypothetical protein
MIITKNRDLVMTQVANLELQAADILECPACNECGAPTRLVGIEPHPTLFRMDLRTYACTQCEEVQALAFPLPKPAN